MYIDQYIQMIYTKILKTRCCKMTANIYEIYTDMVFILKTQAAGYQYIFANV